MVIMFKYTRDNIKNPNKEVDSIQQNAGFGVCVVGWVQGLERKHTATKAENSAVGMTAAGNSCKCCGACKDGCSEWIFLKQKDGE